MNIIYYSLADGLSQPLSDDLQNLVIVIDSRLITTYEITLPKMNFSKANKAIPFALESQILDDIDDVKFFSKRFKKTNIWQVMIINKSILADIAIKLKDIKCNNIVVIPDFMLLPINNTKISYYINNDIVVYRSDDFMGGAITYDLFNQIFKDKEKIIKEKFNYNSLSKFSLLTSNVDENLKKYIKPWKLPIIIASIILLLVTIQIIISNNNLIDKLNQHKDNNEQLFKTLFPEVKRIVNIRSQVKLKLKTANEQSISNNNDFISKLLLQKHNVKANRITFINQQLTIK